MRKAPPAAPPARRLAFPDARRLGAMLLVVLVGLGASGVPLALRYEPSPERAHAAMVALSEGPLSNLRGGHAAFATAALVLTLIHLGRSYAAGRLKAPGRGPLLAGVALLGVLTGAFFTGTILPWDQQGWEAFEHLQSGAGAVGVHVGATDDPASAPLGILFYGHVLAVPVTLVGLLWFHLRRGAPRADLQRIGRLLRDSWRGILATLVLVAAFARLAPPLLGPAPIPVVSVALPAWPFLWLVPLQDAWGTPALFALPLAFVLAFILAWRSGTASANRRRVILAIVAALWGILSLVGAS